MSLLWTIPPVAVVAAAGVVLVSLRGMTDAATDLTSQLHRLDEVRVAVAAVRAETAHSRSAIRSLRSR